MKKALLWVFSILVIVLGILIFLTARYTDRIADPYVRSLLEQNKPMHHRISYKTIRINLISRVLKIKDVRMYPDSSLNRDENIWMEVNVGMVKLTDFRIRDLLFNKTLRIGDFVMLNPEVDIHLPDKVTEKTIDEVAEDTVKTSKPQLLKNIYLERMLISGGNFRLFRKDKVLASSNEISFLARQINLVKDSQDQPLGYSYGDVKVVLSDVKIDSESGLYDMSLDKFLIQKSDSSVILEGFKMKPKYDKKEFSTKVTTQTDRFDLSINAIVLNHIGYRRLMDGQPLKVAKILLDGVNADIYRDKNVAFDFNKYPLFYNESFLRLSLPVTIDTVKVENSAILYNELAAGRTEMGIIRLDEFRLQSFNLSNIVRNDSTDQVMHVFVQAKIMGEGPMNAELILPLKGDLHKIRCSGSVGKMRLSPLNAMLEPSINMKFNDGTVTRMTFFFTGDDYQSNGWMEFLYKDIDVVLLKNDGSNQKKEKGFLSFLANTVTLSNNPPPGKTDFKSVVIGFERDKNKGLINYVWKTIQSGMVRTIVPINKYELKRNQERAKVQASRGMDKN
jgi:hypothetical protein